MQLLYALGNQKTNLSCFIVIFASLSGSGTECVLSPRYAYTQKNIQVSIDITPWIKNPKTLKLNEKRQLTDTNTEITDMSELSDKDFEVPTIKMLQQRITKMLETTEKIENPQQRSLIQETEDIKKDQEKI